MGENSRTFILMYKEQKKFNMTIRNKEGDTRGKVRLQRLPRGKRLIFFTPILLFVIYIIKDGFQIFNHEEKLCINSCIF